MTTLRLCKLSRLTPLLGFALAALLVSCGWRHSSVPATVAPVRSLAELARDPAPWLHMEAYSEQRQPLYLGASPRELELGLVSKDQGRPLLPRFMKERGEAQTALVRGALVAAGKLAPTAAVDFEAWPIRDDAGRLAWALVRYRPTPAALVQTAWRWLDAALLKDDDKDGGPPPALPRALDPADPAQAKLIFKDFLELEGLYDKPAFAECVWTAKDESAPLGSDAPAWLPDARRAAFETAPPGPLCRVTPPPARLNGAPAAWVLTRAPNGLVWPTDIGWKDPFDTLPTRTAAAPESSVVKIWPADFRSALRRDILALDGEHEARFPLSGRVLRFAAKNNADPRNQLALLVAYLEERYKALGLETKRQEFVWRGMNQTNLVAVIPGSLPPGRNHPVLMADHFDSAFCEDEYARSGRRVSAPGADDNLSATGALLRAAEILKDAKPLHDIWLTHFTGEEFPADDLGARAFLGWLLAEKRDIGGLVLLDMIGWRSKADALYQINAGDNAASMALAAVAFDAAATQRSRFRPALRPRFDPRSYLYNTDGLMFSDMGYPVILFNEHMNRVENLNRVGYHHSTDASAKIDWDYLSAIAKTAIESVARLAQTPPRAQ